MLDLTNRSISRARAVALAAAALGAVLLSIRPATTQDLAAQPAILSDEIQRFCGNVADAARDRRYVIQTQELEALKAEIDVRMQQLEVKRIEYEKWMTLRQNFMDSASENVVSIYARMRPDAAAERLASMRSDLAAAILLKLEVKQSGQIMNEMEAATAANLTGIMASAAREEDPT